MTEVFESNGLIANYTLTTESDEPIPSSDQVDSTRHQLSLATQYFNSLSTRKLPKRLREALSILQGNLDLELEEDEDYIDEKLEAKLRQSDKRVWYNSSASSEEQLVDRYTRLVGESQSLKAELDGLKSPIGLDMTSLLNSIASIESRLVRLPSSSIAARLETIKHDALVVVKPHQSLESREMLEKEVSRELESRLSRLEKWVGLHDLSEPTLFSSKVPGSIVSNGILKGVLPGPNLLQIVSDLETKVSLLSPSHLDSISRKVKSLLPELERLSDLKKKVDVSDERDQVTALYRAFQAVEPLVTSLPAIIDRLVQLESLHSEANRLVSSFSEVQTTLSDLERLTDQIGSSMDTVSKGLESNQAIIMDNFKRLEMKLNKSI